jgi:putative chitinase
MKLTKTQLYLIFPEISAEKRTLYLESLNRNFSKFHFDTANKIAAFLVCAFYESQGFEELDEKFWFSTDYLIKTWPQFFNSFNVLANREISFIADKIYSNKHGNGNFHTGDGYKFRGRGVLKLRYRDEYEKFSRFSKIDFVNNPDLLFISDYAIMSGCWMWQEYELSVECNQNDFQGVCRVMFGNLNDFLPKHRLYNKIRKILTT